MDAKVKSLSTMDQFFGVTSNVPSTSTGPNEERVLKLMGYDQHHGTVECMSSGSVVKVEPEDKSEEAADDSRATSFSDDQENSSFELKEFRVQVADPKTPNVFMVFRENSDLEIDSQNEENLDTEAFNQIENNADLEPEEERNLVAPLSTINSHLEKSRSQPIYDAVAESEVRVVDDNIPHQRKRVLLDEIKNASQRSKRPRHEETDFSTRISEQPVPQVIDTAINTLTSAIDMPRGFEAAVNALTSTINKYIELRKLEITLKETKLLLKVKQLRAREKLARAVERIADAKEKKRADL